MRISILFSILLFQFSLIAQIDISGHVRNVNQEALLGATVVLLHAGDSTMQSFSLTNEDGYFLLEDIIEDKYILQVSYVSYNNFSEPLVLDWNADPVVIPVITLKESTETLQEVTITAEHIPMGIYGDTISYNASAFKTKPNATVEDLLKKLPGIKVERNGNIKAQGEDVKNVLVDGKEFFGGDPKMATKNLDAIAIEKVKVYDKKSDIAEFTGVDDGNEEKTINLELKEDYKKGTFGNARGEAGTKDSYNSKLNLFRFNPKMQASAIFSTNNINEETFTINDRIDFMGGFANAIASGTLNLSEQLQMNEGLNESLTSGLNLNYELSPKISFVSHYVFNKGKNHYNNIERSWGFANDFEYLNSDSLESVKRNLDHSLNLKFKVKFNPLTEFVFKNIFFLDQFESLKNSRKYYNLDDRNIGKGIAAFEQESLNKSWQSMSILKRKFKQKGRSVIASFSLKQQSDDLEEVIYARNILNQNTIDLDQKQYYQSNLLLGELSTTYTEPLGKKYFVNIGYTFFSDRETPSKLFYDKINAVDVLNNTLSASYNKENSFHKTSLSLRRNAKKIKAVLGLNLQQSRLSLAINEGVNIGNRNYLNILPQLDLDLDVGRNTDATFKYQNTFVAPSLGQLMPFVNNNAANYEFIGNPDLQPTLAHNTRIGLHHFDQFSLTNFVVNLNFIHSKNKVVNKINIDDNLFQTIQPVNIDRHNALTGFFFFSKPFKPLKLNYSLRLRSSLQFYEGFINNERSKLADQNYNLKLNFRNTNNDIVEINSGIKLDWNSKKFGLNSDYDQSYKTVSYFIDGVVDLPKEIYLTASYDRIHNRNNLYGTEPSFNMIKLEVSKLFLSNKLEVSFSVSDLLNQNIGYSRRGDLNAVYENNFQTLARYYMLGIQYKIGKSKNKKLGL